MKAPDKEKFVEAMDIERKAHKDNKHWVMRK